MNASMDVPKGCREALRRSAYYAALRQKRLLTVGEAMDSGDKATSKALSVARRNMWLDTLLIPTQDKDPDEDHIERGEAYRSAVSYRDELLDSRTSPSRLHQIGAETSHRLSARRQKVRLDGKER